MKCVRPFFSTSFSRNAAFSAAIAAVAFSGAVAAAPEPSSQGSPDSVLRSRDEGWLSAADFDVRCDGVTDDSAALQNAIRHLEAGGVLRLPRGKCVVSRTLVLPAGHWIIEGTGWSTVIAFTGTGSALVFPRITYSGIVARNFRLTGNPQASHGIAMIGRNRTNVTIENLWISGFTKEGSAAIYADNAYKVRILGNLILNNYDGIYFGPTCINNEIDGNFIRGWRRYGVALVGEPRFGDFRNDIRNNIIDEPEPNKGGVAAVYVCEAHLSVIEGNHFELLDSAVVLDCSAQRSTIRSNFCSANTAHCLRIDSEGARDTIVQGDKINAGDVVDLGTRTTYLSTDGTPRAAPATDQQSSTSNPTPKASAVPKSSSSNCRPGEHAADAYFEYVCVGPAKWKRIPLVDW